MSWDFPTPNHQKKNLGLVYPKFQNFYMIKISGFFRKGFHLQITSKIETQSEPKA
jgi:hypothetical protein